MVLTANSSEAAGKNKTRITRESACIYWDTDSEIIDFYMTSKLSTTCTNESGAKGKKSTQTSGGSGSFHWVCWEKVTVKTKSTGFKASECAASCFCPVQKRGSALKYGKNSFDRQMDITYSDQDATIGASGERIVEGLISDDNKVPVGWEVRRSQHCVGTKCPGVEGVTK